MGIGECSVAVVTVLGDEGPLSGMSQDFKVKYNAVVASLQTYYDCIYGTEEEG